LLEKTSLPVILLIGKFKGVYRNSDTKKMSYAKVYFYVFLTGNYTAAIKLRTVAREFTLLSFSKQELFHQRIQIVLVAETCYTNSIRDLTEMLNNASKR
jgi:hypothetical protein